MKVIKCDICKEEIPEDEYYRIVSHELNAPLPYKKDNNVLTLDTDKHDLDICLNCWTKIRRFALVFAEDPHVKIVREDGEPV